MKNRELIKMLAMEILCKLEIMQELCETKSNEGSALEYEIGLANSSVVSIKQMIGEYNG